MLISDTNIMEITNCLLIGLGAHSTGENACLATVGLAENLRLGSSQVLLLNLLLLSC